MSHLKAEVLQKVSLKKRLGSKERALTVDQFDLVLADKDHPGPVPYCKKKQKRSQQALEDDCLVSAAFHHGQSILMVALVRTSSTRSQSRLSLSRRCRLSFSRSRTSRSQRSLSSTTPVSSAGSPRSQHSFSSTTYSPSPSWSARRSHSRLGVSVKDFETMAVIGRGAYSKIMKVATP
jgi:hypothetical protein